LRFATSQAQDLAVEIGDLTPEGLSRLGEWLNGGGKRRISVNQLLGPRGERVQLGAPYDNFTRSAFRVILIGAARVE
jgi:hypothetical protein